MWSHASCKSVKFIILSLVLLLCFCTENCNSFHIKKICFSHPAGHLFSSDKRCSPLICKLQSGSIQFSELTNKFPGNESSQSSLDYSRSLFELINSGLPTFDNSFTIKSDENSEIIFSAFDAADSIIPYELKNIDDRKLYNDVVETIDMIFEYVKSPNDIIVCRFAMLNGVKCPKWHEDNVKWRILKTYCGKGTQWVNPNDVTIRVRNRILSWLSKDLYVEKEKIIQQKVGDILVIRGKSQLNGPSSGFFSVPVLHRSPPVSENDKRILLTITLS